MIETDINCCYFSAMLISTFTSCDICQ